MKIEVQELEPCKYNVVCEADVMTVMDKRGEVLDAFKKAPVPKFRDGKAPMDVIKYHYKNQIEDATKRALAEKVYHDAIFEKDLKVHGPPTFNNIMLMGNSFSCEFVLHTKPSFELKEYKNFEIPKPHQPETESSLYEKLMQELRVKYGEVMPFTDEDKVVAGDNVIVDYEGFIDGVKQDILCSTGEMIRVGDNKFTVVDDHLLGMKIGETKEFDFVVPEEGMPSLSGQLVHLVITLTMGSKSVPMPLNDTLAQAVGKKDFEELKLFVRELSMGKLNALNKTAMNTAISQRLVDNHDIDVPDWMALSEAKYLVDSAKLKWDQLQDTDKERYLDLANKNVKLSLILDKIREEEVDAQLSDQEAFNIVKENLLKTKARDNIDGVMQELNRTGYLQILFARMKDEYVLDYITKTVNVVE